jgi:diaminohydroxyphosphoribosylaminopyrimidine deaminase/5-amino-6-(5-phosphoribosylamino)uracil reductase
MARALALALKGRFGAHPNPMVGAVLVREGRAVGEGFHARFGGPHAEIAALRNAGPLARGSDLLVTLEPCSTFGKTPPCCGALIEAGVRGVVFGAPDPNPANAGRAARLLRKAGIRVSSGLLREECRAINLPFEKLMRARAPFVTLKAAQSLDGKIAPAGREPRGITGEKARRLGRELRAEADAVLTGIGTVLADDPVLDARGIPRARNPVRVVLDSALRLPPESRLARTSGKIRTIAACRPTAPKDRRKALERSGLEVWPFPGQGPLPLAPLLERLGSLGLAHVLVEAGARVNGAFLREGLIDRVVLFLGPSLIGGDDAVPVFGGEGLRFSGPLAGRRLRILSVREAGGDWMIEGLADVHRNH